MKDVLLDVGDLVAQIGLGPHPARVVDGLDLTLKRGETLALLGESGCGKSMTALSLMRLLPHGGRIVSGSVRLGDTDLLRLSEAEMRGVRGGRMAMIFQEPQTSLNPVLTVGEQIAEAARAHEDRPPDRVQDRIVELLRAVGIPDPARRVTEYPHQLSGGMKQRVMIAMALAGGPELLIADEPTTALDVTVQAQILELIKDLQREFHAAVIVITHDLGVVAEVSDKVVVMYGGQIVESGTIDEVYYTPEMPYTLGLMGSVPRMNQPRTTRLNPIPGQPPSLINLPSGCVFRPRCTFTSLVPDDRCSTTRPDLLPTEPPQHLVRCHIEPTARRANSDQFLATLRGAAPAADEPAPAPTGDAT
jgi:peptide/nickel transport system ATP-binding protein